jgi:hypothetical protein
MSDPKRLSISSESHLERALLRSSRLGAPRAGRRRAIAAATATLASGLVESGAASGAACTTTAGGSVAGSSVAGASAAGGSGAAGVAVKVGSALTIKWLAVVGVTGLGAMAAAVAVEHRAPEQSPHRLEIPAELAPALPRTAPAMPSSIAPRAATSPEADPGGGAPRPSLAPSVDMSSSRPPVAAAPPPPAPSPRASSAALGATAAGSLPTPEGTHAESSVRAELAALDQARAALSAGAPARALSILDAYASAYPRGVMAPEATVLRVEALVRAGDRPAAERVGTAFLARSPGSAYAARIRSLLNTGTSNP